MPDFGRRLVIAGLSLFVSACTTQKPTPRANFPNSDMALAVHSRVADCEWNAANQYDDGRYTVSELAQQIMGVCAVELTNATLAFGLSPNDPQVEADQFKQAVENAEAARKARAK